MRSITSFLHRFPAQGPCTPDCNQAQHPLCLLGSTRFWVHRWITSGEYIQMSGRAGRRGKDDKGLVIMMVEETLDMETCRWAVACQ